MRGFFNGGGVTTIAAGGVKVDDNGRSRLRDLLLFGVVVPIFFTKCSSLLLLPTTADPDADVGDGTMVTLTRLRSGQLSSRKDRHSEGDSPCALAAAVGGVHRTGVDGATAEAEAEEDDEEEDEEEEEDEDEVLLEGVLVRGRGEREVVIGVGLVGRESWGGKPGDRGGEVFGWARCWESVMVVGVGVLINSETRSGPSTAVSSQKRSLSKSEVGGAGSGARSMEPRRQTSSQNGNSADMAIVEFDVFLFGRRGGGGGLVSVVVDWDWD